MHLRYDYMKIDVIKFYGKLMYLHNMKGIVYSIKFLDLLFDHDNVIVYFKGLVFMNVM